MVGERQAEANLVYGDNKIGSFERSFKSTRQRKLYLLGLLMKQFRAVRELINDFAFSHPELSAKETSSGSARTTSWMKNEIVMDTQLSTVPRTRSSSMSLTTNERRLEELANDIKWRKINLDLQFRKLVLSQKKLARFYTEEAGIKRREINV